MFYPVSEILFLLHFSASLVNGPVASYYWILWQEVSDSDMAR